jgi:hypothetical protein
MLAVDCAAASGEQTDHCPVERRQIIGLAAGHPVAVLNHFPIHPVAPRVADVVLDGVVAGDTLLGLKPHSFSE